MSSLRIQNLYKTFDRVVAVNLINLDIAEGEFFTLLGSSGCGKTTTLRMVGVSRNPMAAPSTSATSAWFPPTRTFLSSRKSATWAWCSSPMRSGRT